MFTSVNVALLSASKPKYLQEHIDLSGSHRPIECCADEFKQRPWVLCSVKPRKKAPVVLRALSS